MIETPVERVQQEDVAPQIIVPENFVMETKVYFQQKDGSIYDSLTKNVMYFDTTNNRYRGNLLDSNGKVVESEVSLMSQGYKLKLVQGQCERYFHSTEMQLKNFLKMAFDQEAGFFKYVGIDQPEFDSEKVYYKFQNGDATSFYFDQDYRLAFIKYIKSKDVPNEIHRVTVVKKRAFTDEDFLIDGCHIGNAEIKHDLEMLTPKMKETLRAERSMSMGGGKSFGGI